MTDSVVVLCTCANDGEASRIAEALVEERLAACVNLLPPVRSIYRWQGNIEKGLEVLLLIKTNQNRLDDVCRRIRGLHSYDTPEVIALPVASGLEKYLTWLGEQVSD